MNHNFLLVLLLVARHSSNAFVCNGDCIADISKAYSGKYIQLADPIFAGFLQTAQTHFPQIPDQQVKAVIAPIQQKTYEAVQKKAVLELRSPTSVPLSDSLSPSVLDIMNSSMKEALSILHDQVALMTDRNNQPLASHPSQPVPPAQPVRPSTSFKPGNGHGEPFAVSTIPSKAQGAPKVPRGISLKEMDLESLPAGCSMHPPGLGAHETRSSIPNAATADAPSPRRSTPHSKATCGFGLVASVNCLPNFRLFRETLESRWAQIRRTYLSTFMSPHFDHHLRLSQERYAKKRPSSNGMSRVYVQANLEAEKNIEQLKLVSQPDSSDEIEDQILVCNDPNEDIFQTSTIMPDKEEKELTSTWHRALWKFEKEHKILWESLTRELSGRF